MTIFKILKCLLILFINVACIKTYCQNKDTIRKNHIKNHKLISNRVLPSYPGGKDSLNTFLKYNLKKPLGVNDGVVILDFLVNETGIISNIKILKPLNQHCDNEAIRVIKLMPKWVPGKIIGKLISTRYTIQISFKK